MFGDKLFPSSLEVDRELYKYTKVQEDRSKFSFRPLSR